MLVLDSGDVLPGNLRREMRSDQVTWRHDPCMMVGAPHAHSRQRGRPRSSFVFFTPSLNFVVKWWWQWWRAEISGRADALLAARADASTTLAHTGGACPVQRLRHAWSTGTERFGSRQGARRRRRPSCNSRKSGRGPLHQQVSVAVRRIWMDRIDHTNCAFGMSHELCLSRD
jgi:hypothetical protein